MKQNHSLIFLLVKMRNMQQALVVLATFLFTFLLRGTTGFSIEQNIIPSLVHGGLNLNSILTNSSRDLEKKWLVKAATPSYLQTFLELVEGLNATDRSSAIDQEDIGKDFFDSLLDGVSSDSCKGHVTEWFWRWLDLKRLTQEEDKWVLHMLDAWGKLPEGILSGHVNSYGDFHECVQIEVKNLKIFNSIYDKEKIAKSFEGQYCTAYLLSYNTSMSVTPKPPVQDGFQQKFAKTHNGIQESVSLGEFLKTLLDSPPTSVMMLPTVAVCLPNSCSNPDVQQILVNGLVMMNYSNSLMWPVAANCLDNNKPPLDAAAIIVIILLVILVTLAVVAGVLDYWYSQAAENTSPPTPVAYKYLMAFSFYTNLKKFLSTRKSPDDLGCLHGIRFLSTAWVVLAHTYFVFISGPQWNMIDARNSHKDWTVLAVINGTFSVDTFFLMSGMLATYNILKMLDKTRGKFNVIMFYVHRYVRLTPTYAILVGIAATLLNYTGNGPNWGGMKLGEEHCRKNWYTNILYVNNLVHSMEMCNGESWYLANDMQFYILSPLIVYPIWRWEMMGILLLTIYTIMSCISQVLVVRYAQGAPAAMAFTGNLGDSSSINEIYFRPWSRIAPFLIGVWLGWILHKTRGRRTHLSKPVIAALWLCSTGIALADLFGIHSWFDPDNNGIPKIPGYFYAGLSRMSWGVAISWVIFACVKGYGGVIDKFLSWKVFMPLGRLCFCVYLTSIHIQSIFHSRLAVPIKWDTYTVVNLFFAHMVMSYIVGFICSLLFESPFITLQKLLFEGNGARQQPKQKKLTDSSDSDIGVDISSSSADKIIIKP